MKHWYNISLVLVLMSLLSSCALLKKKTTRSPTVVETDIPIVAEKAVNKAPGSLWSEGSFWNNMFSADYVRKRGDIIFLQPTPRFKKLIALQKRKVATEIANQAQLAQRTPSSQEEENDILPATIEQKHVGGIYSIKARQKKTGSSGEEEISLTGKIREKDLGKNDTIATDLIFDLRVTLKESVDEQSGEGSEK